MLEVQLHLTKRRLEVVPATITVVLTEEGTDSLSAILPPLAELMEIRQLSEQNFSLRQISADNDARMRDVLRFHLDRLLEKEEKFGSFATYLSHVADLHEMLGETEDAQNRLQAAELMAPSLFFQHRIGANLISLGKMDEALSLFSNLDLSTDVQGNLRLAYLSVKDNRIIDAIAAVDKALHICPVDFGARLFRGALSLLMGDVSRAVQNFKFALEERPSAAAYTNLAVSYVMLQRPDKAFSALRKATALEPYNENAVGLLADLAFLENRNQLAIAPLERFVGFEQKSVAGWARLARAFLELDYKRKAVGALKRQASVKESSGVFNNLGVAHQQLGDGPKAVQYFRYAMSLANESAPAELLLPAYNLISSLCQSGDYVAAQNVASSIIKQDLGNRLAADPVFSNIYALYVVALLRTGARKEAVRLSKRLLTSVADAAPGLRVGLISSLVADFAMSPERFDDALAVGLEGIKEARNLDRHDERLLILYNNLAFLFLEMGQPEEAEQYLAKIAKSFHTEPYPTATLGLFHFRKGHAEKGQLLYEEAMRLAFSAIDRHRIGQKLNFELGKVLLEKDPRQARRRLLMAAKDSEPIPQIRERAQQLLLLLKNK